MGLPREQLERQRRELARTATWTSRMKHSTYSIVLPNRRSIAFAVAFCLYSLQAPPAHRVQAEDGSVSRASDLPALEKSLAEREYDSAINIGRELAKSSAGSTDLTLPLARLARTLQQADRLPEAAEFYQLAVAASERPQAKNLAPAKVALVRLAASAVLTQVNQLSDAISTLEPVLRGSSGAGENQQSMAVTVLLRIGATALATGDTTAASRAYSLAAERAEGDELATALLGDAWATAIQRQEPVIAARKLADFIDRFPNHGDASRAARACAECLKQAGRDEDSSVMLADLLQRWPDSESAAEVVAAHRDLSIDVVPDAVCDWLIESANSDRVQKLDGRTTIQGMLAAARNKRAAEWSKLARHLGEVDTTGQLTSEVLMKFTEQSEESDAERLATILIAPLEPGSIQPKACEAACRWAGRTQRWSMLALASESETTGKVDPARTMAVERLFAEGLMQLGRVDEARRWWDHIVDTRHATDFSTLLRCAEAETSVGTDGSTARKRIDAARKAAGEARYENALVDLLEAELSIRRGEFDIARGLLEQVVRLNQGDAGLRGRAQWLIGETHYLQHHFAEAIESYRRVEGIDPGGMWVSASLIQAGKSFEQLGRTREATICYGNLLTRFPETSHADLARRRLAAITPNSGPSVSPSNVPKRR